MTSRSKNFASLSASEFLSLIQHVMASKDVKVFILLEKVLNLGHEKSDFSVVQTHQASVAHRFSVARKFVGQAN